MRYRIILLSVAAILALVNALISHFFYYPLILIGFYFIICIIVGRTRPDNIIFWNSVTPILVAVAHAFTYALSENSKFFMGTPIGSFVYATLLSISGTLIGKSLLTGIRVWYWVVITITVVFFILASVIPKHLPENHIFSLQPPVILNYVDIHQQFPIYCGTCMAGDNYNYYEWRFNDLRVQDSILVCFHYDRDVSCLVYEFEITTSDSIGKVISAYFAISDTDSTSVIDGYKIERNYLQSEYQTRLTTKFRVIPETSWSGHRELLRISMFPHYLTTGIL